MAQVGLVAERSAPAEVQAVYEEIKKTLGIPVVPNLFKAMASNPDYLEATWNQFKATMRPGELTRREKELVALAVLEAEEILGPVNHRHFSFMGYIPIAGTLLGETGPEVAQKLCQDRVDLVVLAPA